MSLNSPTSDADPAASSRYRHTLRGPDGKFLPGPNTKSPAKPKPKSSRKTKKTLHAKKSKKSKKANPSRAAKTQLGLSHRSLLADLPAMPTTREMINDAAESLLGVRFPGVSMCPHHHSPLEYLEASFIRQEDLLVWANRGGGKTLLAAAATLFDAIYRAPVKIRILGGSFDQSDRLAEYIREFVHRRPELVEGRMTRDCLRTVGGSEIRMLAQSQRAVRGQHVQKIRCDEVDLFDSDVWQAVQFATRSSGETRGSIEVLSTLHRAGGLMHQLVREAQTAAGAGQKSAAQVQGYQLINWCLWEVIERCPPSRRCGDCLLAEDCRGIARRAEGFFRIDDAIAIKARSSRAAWEAEMLCRGPQRQFLVFEEFDPATHIRPVEYCADWPLYRAMDFGYASPLTCLWIQLTPSGAVHVIDEYARKRVPLARHAAAIREKDPGPVQISFVDPAGNQRESTSGAACTELLASAGLPCTWRASRIADGLELVRAALSPATGEPKLFVHPRCTILIDAFNSYHYPSPDQSGDPDRPIKDGPDHAIDALRYFFVNRLWPGGKIQRKRY